MVHKSDVVITICQELQDTVTEMGVADRALLIENVMGGDVDEPPRRSPAEVRTAWGIARGAPLALYTGTFEAYQGVDMLIDAAAIVAKSRPDARVLVVGGEPAQVDSARKARAAAAGASAVMVFTGQQPAKEIPGFVQARRSAGVAAHSRHQHAAQDLFVSAIGQADRGDQPADAHAGADAGDREAGRSRSRSRLPPRCLRSVDQPGRARRGCRRPRARGRAGEILARVVPAAARPRPTTRLSVQPADCRHAPQSTASAKELRAGESAGDRRDRFHRWTSRAVSGRPRRRGAGAGAAAEPRPIRSIAAAARRA